MPCFSNSLSSLATYTVKQHRFAWKVEILIFSAAGAGVASNAKEDATRQIARSAALRAFITSSHFCPVILRCAAQPRLEG